MSTIYNRPFKIGFVATIIFFALMNLVAYLFASRLYDQLKNQPISWAPGPRFPEWGIPFSWEGASGLFRGAEGLVLNFFTIVAIAFLVGFIFRLIALRIIK